MELAFAGRLLAACVAIALVLLALRFVVRRATGMGATGGRRGRLVAVVETTPLPNAASLHVVRVVDRYYVVGRTGSSLATLCEIPSEALAARAP